MSKRILLTGAPGSGKSTTIHALIASNIHCMPEYAREIIAEQRSINGKGLYDQDKALFKELMLSRAIYQYQQATEMTVYDRGIPDILAYSDCFALARGAEMKAAQHFRYDKVFFLPSWEAIYSNDNDRTISFSEAKVFGDNLKKIYQQLNYKLIEVPCSNVTDRVEFIKAKMLT